MPRKKTKLIPKGESLMRLIMDMDKMVVEGKKIVPNLDDILDPSKRTALVSLWNEVEQKWRDERPTAEHQRPSRAKPGAGPRGRKPTSGMPKSFARRGINTLDGLQKKLRVVALHRLAPNIPPPAYFLKGVKYKKKPKTLVDSLAFVGYILPGNIFCIQEHSNSGVPLVKEDVVKYIQRSNSTCSVRTLTEWRQKACHKMILAHRVGGIPSEDWEELRLKVVERFGDGGTAFLTNPEIWIEFLNAGAMAYNAIVEPLSADMKAFFDFYRTAMRTWALERSHQRRSIKIANADAARQEDKVKFDRDHHLISTEAETLRPSKQPRMDVIPESVPETWHEPKLNTYFSKESV